MGEGGCPSRVRGLMRATGFHQMAFSQFGTIGEARVKVKKIL
jgi:hypothetical protein